MSYLDIRSFLLEDSEYCNLQFVESNWILMRSNFRDQHNPRRSSRLEDWNNEWVVIQSDNIYIGKIILPCVYRLWSTDVQLKDGLVLQPGMKIRTLTKKEKVQIADYIDSVKYYKMPGLTEFFNGFNIRHGLQLGSYILSNIQGDHQEIVRYRQYQYPIELTFVPQYSYVNPQELLNQLMSFVSGTRIIYSHYGNPYECDFGTPGISRIDPNGTIIISTIGHGYRV